MSAKVQLDCKVIPVETGNLLIPERLVEEVVTLEEKDTQERMSWRSRKVPIVQNDHNDKPATRVVIVRSVMGYKELPFLAIATDGIPHKVTVSADALTLVSAEDAKKIDCPMAASYANVGSLVCTIPDLPKLESKLSKEARILRG